MPPSRHSARERRAVAASSSCSLSSRDGEYAPDDARRQAPNAKDVEVHAAEKARPPSPPLPHAHGSSASPALGPALLAPVSPHSVRRAGTKRRQRRTPAAKNAWSKTKFLRQFEDEQNARREERFCFPVHSMCQAEGYNLRALYEALIARHCYARFLDDSGTVLYLELPDDDLPMIEVKARSQDRYETFLRVLAPGPHRQSCASSPLPHLWGVSPERRKPSHFAFGGSADAPPGGVDARPLLSTAAGSAQPQGEEAPDDTRGDSAVGRRGSLYRDYSAPARGHFSMLRGEREEAGEPDGQQGQRRGEETGARGRRDRDGKSAFDTFHEKARSHSQSSVSSTPSCERNPCAGRCEGREGSDGDAEQFLDAAERGSARTVDDRERRRREQETGDHDLSDDETTAQSRKHASMRRRREKHGAVAASLSPTFSLSSVDRAESTDSSPSARGFFGQFLVDRTRSVEARPAGSAAVSKLSSFSLSAWTRAGKGGGFSFEANATRRDRGDEAAEELAYFPLAGEEGRDDNASRVVVLQPRREEKDREREGEEREGDRSGSCFVFSNGAIVVWGRGDVGGSEIKRDMLSNLLWFLGKFATGFLRVDMTQEDVMFYSYIDDLRHWSPSSAIPRRRIKQNRLYLKTREVSEKLAASFAIAQSVRLDVYEALVNETIARVQEVPERMSRFGCDFSGEESNHGGWLSLFQIRSCLKEGEEEQCDAYNKQFADLSVKIINVNIIESFLDVPDFFWEDDRWQSFWQRVHHHLELQERIDILNTRYSCIRELLNLVRREQSQDHEFRLTWIIVLLLIAQVIAAAVKYVVLNQS